MSLTLNQNFGAVATAFAGQKVEDELSAGIQASFGIIGYKGKVWSTRYRGEETTLMRPDGDGPRSSIEVVVVKASKHISKIFYADGYVEGSSAAPDCFSNDGLAPEPTSAKKQCDTCALCPHNQWGSRITTTGKQGKSCSDSKRLAVVPADDIANEAMGGPMLLRVPAASLNDVATYGQKMAQQGYPSYAIVTKIGFDHNEAFPKFTFGAVRPLTDAEAPTILSMREGHAVNRILSENEFQPQAAAPASSGVNTTFEQPVQPTDKGTVENPQVGTQAAVEPKAEEKVVAQTETKPSKTQEEIELEEFRAMKREAAEAKAAEEQRQKEAAKAKAAEEARLKAEAEAQKKAQLEAEVAAAEAKVTETKPEKTQEEIELEEFRAMKRAAAAKASETQTSEVKTPEVTTQVTTSEPQAEVKADAAAPDVNILNTASKFEAELEDMLAGLLPK